MPNYTFKTPTVSEGPIGGHRLFYFRKKNVGVTIVKYDGVYSTVRYVQDSYINEAQESYRGGYEYTVDDARKAALIAGGVGVTEANFTIQ
jgi:hypothetical protein